jgi:sugar-specific transcriptional regulator TrmB
MDKKVLLEFGLTQNEADIFVSLVAGGAMSATEIAKELGLNRPYVYYALERLLEKGFISQINEGGKRKFNAVTPTQLLMLEEHKFDELRKLLSDLEKAKKKPEEETTVEVLKGKHVVKNLFKRLVLEMKPKQETVSIGFDEQMMEAAEPINIRRVFSFMEKNGITERAIIRKGSKTLEYAKTTEYKSIPAEMIGNTAKYIYNDVVVHLIYGMPTYAVIVKNARMAEAERKQFEVFWKVAKRK